MLTLLQLAFWTISSFPPAEVYHKNWKGRQIFMNGPLPYAVAKHFCQTTLAHGEQILIVK